jgi:hypothetical protein
VKKILLLALFSLSTTSAFSQTCTVKMVDIRSQQTIQTFRAFGDPSSCVEGMRECRKQIRLQNRYGMADCFVQGSVQPSPIPYPQQPQPFPQPFPDHNPNPYPGMDAQRPLGLGESVYYNDRISTVQGISFNGTYALVTTDNWGTRITVNNIGRAAISVTSGCSGDVCVNEKLYIVNTSREATIVGLQFNGNFIVRTTDNWGTSVINSNVDRRNLAVARGCISGQWVTLCVGQPVIDANNRRATILAIQYNGKVIIRTTDNWGTSIIQSNVDPSTLFITR